MLYIRKYDKFDLDKNAKSMMAYFLSKFGDLNYDISNLITLLTEILNNLVETQAELRVIIKDTKAIVEDNKDAARAANFGTDYFDKLIDILDKSEEDINQIVEDITDLRDDIIQDCSQTTPEIETCTYEPDCNESDDCNYNTPCNEEEYPSFPTPQDDSGCSFCSYTSVLDFGCYEGDNQYDSCAVCNHEGCMVDVECQEEGTDIPVDVRGCGGNVEVSIEDLETCSEIITTVTDPTCDQTKTECQHKDSDAWVIPDECPFTCNVGSPCGEISIPAQCEFTDNGDSTCTYDSTYCTYYSESCNEIGGNGSSFDDCGEYDPRICNEVYCEAGNDDPELCGQCDETCDYYSGCDEENCGGCVGGQNDDDCNETCCVWDDPQSCNFTASCESGDDIPDDDDDDDDDGNVICTYVIKRLFGGDLQEYYLRESDYNIRLGFRGGLTGKYLREYATDLGPKIISYLERETDDYLQGLWNTEIVPVWLDLRRDNRKGYLRYCDLVSKLSNKYGIKTDLPERGKTNTLENK